MAEFDPSIPPDNSANYLGYSRGSIPDSSTGGLFTDAAQMVTDTTKVVNNFYENTIRRQLTEGYDEIRDVFTGRRDFDIVASQAGREPNRLGAASLGQTPEEVRAHAERLQSLTDMRRAGRLQDSHFWMLADSHSRQIRQRYPGYRQEIDQMTSQILGATPANRLIQELSQESNARGDRSRQEREYWLRHATDQGVAADVNARAQAGNPVTNEELQQRINTVQAQRHGTQQRKSELELAHARGVNVREDASRSATQEILQQQSNVIQMATSGIGLSLRQIQDAATNISTSGRTPSANELNALRTRFANEVRLPLQQQANASLYATREGGQSWASLMQSPEEIAKVLGAANANLAAIEGYLGSGNFSALGTITANLQSIQQGDHLAALDHNPLLRNVETSVKIFGNQVVTAQIFQNHPQFGVALNSLLGRQVAQAGATGTPLQAQLDAAQNHPDFKPEMIYERIRRGTHVLSMDNPPRQGLINFATSHFGTANANFLDKVTNKADVYAQMVGDPRVARNMLTLRDEHPQLYEQYRQWTVNNFTGAMNETARTAQGIVLNPSAGETVLYSPTTNSFVLQGAPTGLLGEQHRTTVGRLNNTIAGLTNMLKAEGMDDAQARELVGGMVAQLPINTNTTARGGVGTSLWDAARMAAWRRGEQATGERTDPPRASSRQVAPVLDVIGRGEAGQFGYNQGFAARAGSGGRLVGQQYPDLTNMTLTEVQGLQRNIIGGQRQGGIPTGEASSAIGRYQFIQDRLNETIREMGLNPNTTRFTPEIQDAMAMHQLNKMGLQEYLSGRVSTEQMMDRMSSFWAALPNSRGGANITTGQNATNRSVREVRDALEEMKRNFTRR